jgi:hypothetical protein
VWLSSETTLRAQAGKQRALDLINKEKKIQRLKQERDELLAKLEELKSLRSIPGVTHNLYAKLLLVSVLLNIISITMELTGDFFYFILITILGCICFSFSFLFLLSPRLLHRIVGDKSELL